MYQHYVILRLAILDKNRKIFPSIKNTNETVRDIKTPFGISQAIYHHQSEFLHVIIYLLYLPKILHPVAI